MFRHRVGGCARSRCGVLRCSAQPAPEPVRVGTNNQNGAAQKVENRTAMPVLENLDTLKPMVSLRSLDGFEDFDASSLLEAESEDLATTVHAIILAGGASDNPLARVRAVPALPLGGTYALIDVAIANCLRSGVNKMHVLTQFNSHMLTSYLAKMYPPMSFGGIANASFVDCIACTQTPLDASWAKGSADAVRRALPKLYISLNVPAPDDILVLTGGDVFEVDFHSVISQHRRSSADITVLTQSAAASEFKGDWHFGVCRQDTSSGQLAEFLEKPTKEDLPRFAGSSKKPYEVSMGMYVFKRTALEKLITEGAGLNDCHFGYDTVPRAIDSGMKVVSSQQFGLWSKCSSVKDYYDTNIMLADQEKMPSVFSYMRTASNCGRSDPPTRMTKMKIDRTFVGDGSVLMGGSIKRSVVGTNSYIGADCDIEDTVINGLSGFHSQSLHELWEEQFGTAPGVGRGCKFRNVLLDLDARVGNNVELINRDNVQEADMEEDGIIVRDGIIVVLKGASVRDGFKF